MAASHSLAAPPSEHDFGQNLEKSDSVALGSCFGIAGSEIVAYIQGKKIVEGWKPECSRSGSEEVVRRILVRDLVLERELVNCSFDAAAAAAVVEPVAAAAAVGAQD